MKQKTANANRAVHPRATVVRAQSYRQADAHAPRRASFYRECIAFFVLLLLVLAVSIFTLPPFVQADYTPVPQAAAAWAPRDAEEDHNHGEREENQR